MADEAGRSYRVRERARDTIRFEEDLRRRIIAKAEQDGSSQNEVVNQLCQRALDADVLAKGDVPTLLQEGLCIDKFMLNVLVYLVAALPVKMFNRVDAAALDAARKVLKNAQDAVMGGPADEV